MATSTIVLELKMRWWVPVYLRTLMMFCILIRQEPDYDKAAIRKIEESRASQ